jgi:hypothetical protein
MYGPGWETGVLDVRGEAALAGKICLKTLVFLTLNHLPLEQKRTDISSNEPDFLQGAP